MKFLILNDYDHPFRLKIPLPVLGLFENNYKRAPLIFDFNLKRKLSFVLGYSKVEIDFFLINDQKSFFNYVMSLHYLFNRNKQSSSMLRIFDYNNYDHCTDFHDIINQDPLGYTKIPSYSMNLSYQKPMRNEFVRIQISQTDLSPMQNSLASGHNHKALTNGSHPKSHLDKHLCNELTLSKILNIHNFNDLSLKECILSIYIPKVKSLRHNPFPAKWLENTRQMKKIPWIKSNYEIHFPTIHSLIAESSKLRTLDNLLGKLKKAKHRVLIFCQMTKMMNIIEDYLQFKKYKYYRLDGGSGINDRRDMVDGFQNRTDIFVFLLSTRAGGLGVTLTAADDVIFYDNDWNPTMDAQAEDRAHRIGNFLTLYNL